VVRVGGVERSQERPRVTDERHGSARFIRNRLSRYLSGT
jgi:hypothetical protein